MFLLSLRPSPAPMTALLMVAIGSFLFGQVPENAKAADSPADFLVLVKDEAFVIRLVRQDQIAIADGRAKGVKPQGIVSGKLEDGDGGFNRDPRTGRRWSWHMSPESISFPELAMEVCDGRPSDVEGDKQHWISDVKRFCPWSAKIVLRLPLSRDDYQIPDPLPARAKLKLVKTESNAAWYKATWDNDFQFDPQKASLALDMNTVNWRSMAKITVSNKDDNMNGVGHQHLQGPSPTTDSFENPPEHVLISPLESGWVKEGGISILIRNDHTEGEKPPKIVSVDLVKGQ